MCFGGSGSSKTTTPTTTLPTDSRVFYQWWRPMQIDAPKLDLNADALGRKGLSSKRLGKRRLQIPLAPDVGGAGLATTPYRK